MMHLTPPSPHFASLTPHNAEREKCAQRFAIANEQEDEKT